VRGEAKNRDEVMHAARGRPSSHGVNPPGHRKWPQLVPPPSARVSPSQLSSHNANLFRVRGHKHRFLWPARCLEHVRCRSNFTFKDIENISAHTAIMSSVKHQYFHPQYGIALVKQGFCWPAFIFGSLWALARRVYPLFFVMLALEVALWFVTGYAAAQGLLGLAFLGLFGTLGYAIVRGKYGNRWVQSFLVARGYNQRNGNAGT
jgi:hypothetical protein